MPSAPLIGSPRSATLKRVVSRTDERHAFANADRSHDSRIIETLTRLRRVRA